MSSPQNHSEVNSHDNADHLAGRNQAPPKRKTLHEDVQTWDDVCSCEPEPRWRDLKDDPPQSS